jgi:predicted ArsR family transcriptional regulator
VDRLTLFRALADPSRYSVFEEVARAKAPPSTAEIADRLDLHPNTVRLHLDKLHDAGLLEVAVDRHGSVGRPQHRWSLTQGAPALGLEPSGSRLLARLLAEVAAQPGGGPERAASVGRALGLERSAQSTGHRKQRGGPERMRAECLRSFVEELAALGFDPSLDDTPSPEGASVPTSAVAFTKCPFREVAALYPDLVCELHRGLTEGILEGVAGHTPGVEAKVESFSSLVDADPCRAEVSISA